MIEGCVIEVGAHGQPQPGGARLDRWRPETAYEHAAFAAGQRGGDCGLRVATNSESAAIARHAAALAEVAVQSFVTRTDMGCGSTIGPLTATALGVRTVDIGVPTFAMHSIRELAGRDDAWALYRLLGAFYGLPDLGVRRA